MSAARSIAVRACVAVLFTGAAVPAAAQYGRGYGGSQYQAQAFLDAEFKAMQRAFDQLQGAPGECPGYLVVARKEFPVIERVLGHCADPGAATCPVKPEAVPKLRSLWAAFSLRFAGCTLQDSFREGSSGREHVQELLSQVENLPRLARDMPPDLEESRLKLLDLVRQQLCATGLRTVSEAESRVDPGLAKRIVAACPRPSFQPPASEENRKVWVELVRAYVSAVAVTDARRDLLAMVPRYADGLRSLRPPPSGNAIADLARRLAQPELGEEVAGEVRAFGLVAAAADGDLDGIEEQVGEPFDRAGDFRLAGYVARHVPPRWSGLRDLILQHLSSRLDAGKTRDLARRAVQRRDELDREDPRLGARRVVAQVLAQLALHVTEDLDGALAAGQGDVLVSLFKAASGTPSEVFRQWPLARPATLEDMYLRVCRASPTPSLCLAMAGDRHLAARRYDEAERLYVEGREGLDASASVAGLFVLARARDRADDARRLAAELLPSNRSRFDWVLDRVGDEPGRRMILDGLLAQVQSAQKGEAKWRKTRLDTLRTALLDLAFRVPGSESARQALAAIPKTGTFDDPRERLRLALVNAQDAFMRGRDGPWWSFVKAKRTEAKDREAVAEWVVGFADWVARLGRYEALDKLVDRTDPKMLGAVVLLRLARQLPAAEVARARRLVDRAVGLGVTGPVERVELANTWLSLDRVPDAAQALEALGPQDRWGADAWAAAGWVRDRQARLRAAYEAFGAQARAVSTMPEVATALASRANVALKSGRLDEAEADALDRIAIEGADSKAFQALGWIRFDGDRLDEAVDAWERLLYWRPRDADSRLGLALARFRAGDLGEARAELARAVEIDPVLGKGWEAAEKAGYFYTPPERKAWEELLVALGAAPK